MTPISRRSVLSLVLTSVSLPRMAMAGKINLMKKAAPFVKPRDTWSANNLFDFLRMLPPTAILNLKQTQGMLKQTDTERDLLGPDADARSIQKQLLRVSSSVFTRPMKKAATLDYHKVVVWLAHKSGVNESIIETSSTFLLERELYKLLFEQLWDKLSEQQRAELLNKIDSTGALADKTGIVAMGGASAVAVLSGSVVFYGFAFYSAMSVTIASVASAVGVTLPFAAYASASSAVAFLSGPIGWAITGVVGLGGALLAGRADVKKTTALVAQIHALKIEALKAAKVSEKEIFRS